jgi:metal-responsive CopG/Arc/MetJ family transcriptional regulator
MAKYSKKVQVLLTEQQLKDLEEIASKNHKKLGTLVREAIEEYHLKKNKQQKIAEAVDRLLSLPEVPVPENWEEFEQELAKTHGIHE